MKAPASAVLLAGLAALAGACRKAAAPPPAGSVRYERAASPRAALHVPESWRVLENQGGAHLVSLLGPAEGARPFARSLGLYFHEAGGVYGSVEEYASAQKRAGTRSTQSAQRSWKGRTILELTTTRKAQRRVHSSELETRRERMALVPGKDGFYLLLSSSPEPDAAAADEVYARALESLELPE